MDRMRMKDLENDLSVYVSEWMDARWQHWNFIHTSIHRDRRTGIYRLKQGERLLDYLNSIMGNIEDHLGMEKGQRLIPSNFSSVSQFAKFLQNFTQFLRDNYHLVETNFKGEQTDFIVVDIANMVNEIIEMSNRCLDVILSDDNVPIPYQQVKKCLYESDIKEFVNLINSIIKSVPYLIHKEKFNEGYFHSFFHVALTLIGMRPLSEVVTSDGRIDMVLDCPKTVFIMEFKYSPNDKDLSKVALEQIKSKKYHLPYIIQQKPIVGIGFSFGEGTREITNFTDETLYQPELNLDNRVL